MRSYYSRYGKRSFDIFFSILLLIILFPLMLLIALIVRIDSPGSILFIQERLGKDAKIFRAIKFRTMTDKHRIPKREILNRDPELTRIGFWLRRFKLDEFPQLINIIIGHMSFVGPRPALPDQIILYDTHSRRRLDVRPGLTGLAQVSGNIYLSWPERWKLDVNYVDRLSLRLDLSIILLTLGVVILGEERFVRRHEDNQDQQSHL